MYLVQIRRYGHQNNMILNDMKGDYMIIYNMIRVVIVKIQVFTIFTFYL